MVDEVAIAAAAERLSRPDGHFLAYRALPGKAPGVVFLTGFRSDMDGTKAQALAEACRAEGRAFVRFDYFGHGESSGDFRAGTIGRWADDALAVLDGLTRGPQILVGSSLGGWLMLLAARARPERVHGLLGIAAAPDFTEDLLFQALDPETRAVLRRDGAIEVPSEYDDGPTPVTWKLIEEARRHLVLRSPLEITCPVRLIHGAADTAVPWATSIKLAEALAATDVEITLVKNADHRLSTDPDLARLRRVLADLAARPY